MDAICCNSNNNTSGSSSSNNNNNNNYNNETLDEIIVRISRELRICDVTHLKFLCSEILSVSDVETSTGFQLLTKLADKHWIRQNDDYWFLAKCLKKINRIDLLKTFAPYYDTETAIMAEFYDFNSDELSQFRSVLFDVAMEMTSKNVEKLQFLYRKKIRLRGESVPECVDLFTSLIEAGIISETNFQDLAQKLGTIGRTDLQTRLNGINRDLFYKMDSDIRGHCVIINNINFRNLSYRAGAELDEMNLKKLFTDLHFRVKIHQDLSSTDMKNCLEDYFYNKSHINFDCFACFIMSHGAKGRVFGTDDVAVQIKDLVDLYHDHRCPTLKDKPKLFFIQACQLLHNESATDSDESTLSPCPLNMADISLFTSTVPGYNSYRNPSTGSPFVNHIVDVFSTQATHMNLTDMISQVINRVSYEGVPNRQLPSHEHTLRKVCRFSLNSGTLAAAPPLPAPSLKQLKLQELRLQQLRLQQSPVAPPLPAPPLPEQIQQIQEITLEQLQLQELKREQSPVAPPLPAPQQPTAPPLPAPPLREQILQIQEITLEQLQLQDLQLQQLPVAQPLPSLEQLQQLLQQSRVAPPLPAPSLEQQQLQQQQSSVAQPLATTPPQPDVYNAANQCDDDDDSRQCNIGFHGDDFQSAMIDYALTECAENITATQDLLNRLAR